VDETRAGASPAPTNKNRFVDVNKMEFRKNLYAIIQGRKFSARTRKILILQPYHATTKTTMKYNPQIHHRKSIRLKGYDYSQAGLYFITICVQDRKCLFGKIENDEMILNDFGTIACQQWQKLPQRFTHMELDVFQIMPNHHAWDNFIDGIRRGQPLRLPMIRLRNQKPLVTLLVYTNRWWQMIVWKY
jgi:hypothetical protein